MKEVRNWLNWNIGRMDAEFGATRPNMALELTAQRPRAIGSCALDDKDGVTWIGEATQLHVHSRSLIVALN